MSLYKFHTGGQRLFMSSSTASQRHTSATSLDETDSRHGHGPSPGPGAGHSPSPLPSLAQVSTQRHLSSDHHETASQMRRSERHGAVKSVTMRVVKKTTTVSRGQQNTRLESLVETADGHAFLPSNQQQISDIVDGDDTMSIREALLRWAQTTTERYPGVQVKNFTSSWRDGLAFLAIIHRNRPDLIDWKEVQQMSIRSRIELAFRVVEREYGVTRLLDPEDVDTSKADEKSLITYISSLYDIFPEPPVDHPLYNAAAEKTLEEYRASARRFLSWVHEETVRIQALAVPKSVPELRQTLRDIEHFTNHQLAAKLTEKNRLAQQYMQLERSFDELGQLKLEPELHVQLLERSWSQLTQSQLEYQSSVQQQLSKLERQQTLIDKIQHEIRSTDRRLDSLESDVSDLTRRVGKTRPRDIKHECEKIEMELVKVERTITQLFSDVNALQETRHPQAPVLYRDVQQLHNKFCSVQTHMQEQVLNPLSKRLNEDPDTMLKRLIEADDNFRFLSECLEWVSEKLVQLRDAEYGHDLHSCQHELQLQHKEHKVIDHFQVNLERCVSARKNYDDEELTLYMRLLSQLQKSYADLLSSSNKRLSDLMILHDFVQAATSELIWLNEKEETEVARDWSSRDQDLRKVDAQYEQLMADLERRERQFQSAQEQGGSLVAQQHPAANTVQAYLAALQSQWAWLLQLTLCLETHLKHAQFAHTFFHDVDELSQTIKRQDERLNGEFSVTEFSLDDGERLLRAMQSLRDTMSEQADALLPELEARAQQVTPQSQRRTPDTAAGSRLTAICSYKNNQASVRKQDECELVGGASAAHHWSVRTPAALVTEVPSVCLLLPPPDEEALRALRQLQRQHELSAALWQRKQLRLRQNMIFATIKVVKSWDLQQFVAMGKEQRDAIRRALNEDADKLVREGEPGDTQLRRLQREIDQVNQLFDEFERLASEASPTNQFNTKMAVLLKEFESAEAELKQLCSDPLPDDTEETNRLLSQHKEWQKKLRRHEPTLDQVQAIYDSLSTKSAAMQSNLQRALALWDSLWSDSHAYIDRMKMASSLLSQLVSVEQTAGQLEKQLSQYKQLPDDKSGLRSLHLELINVQTSLHEHRMSADQLTADMQTTRQMTEKTRPRQRHHADLDLLQDRVERATRRLTACCHQVDDRLRAVNQAAELLNQYEQQELMNKQMQQQMEAEAERARKALVDRFQVCDTGVTKLLAWVETMEQKLADQQPAQEEAANLRNQINIVKAVKDELKDGQRSVTSTLDQVNDVLERGEELLDKSESALSADQMARLKNNGQQLRQRYDNVADSADAVLRQLHVCLDQLNKYKNDLISFQSWLEVAERSLVDRERQVTGDCARLSVLERACRDACSDIMARQADLRFITVASQRFVDESQQYLASVNELRANLPRRLRPLEQRCHATKRETEQADKDYQSLLARCHQLLERVSQLADCQRRLQQSTDAAGHWLREHEPAVRRLLAEPLATEPRRVQQQLAAVRQLGVDLQAGSQLVDKVQVASDQLLRLLSAPSGGAAGGGGGASLPAAERQQIESQPAELRRRWRQLCDDTAARAGQLERLLAQSQDVLDGVDSLSDWLKQAEARLQQLSAPASLVRQRLAEQLQLQQLLAEDVQRHAVKVQHVCSEAKQLSAHAAVTDVGQRYQALRDGCERRGALFKQVASDLDKFLPRAEKHRDWLLQQLQLLDGQPPEAAAAAGSGGGGADQLIKSVAGERAQHATEHEHLLASGQRLLHMKDTTDSAMLQDTLQELSQLWQDLEQLVTDRQAEARSRSDSLSAYQRLRDEVTRWLERMEARIEAMKPVALDQSVIKRQQDETETLLDDHDKFGDTLDRFGDMARQYDALVSGERSSCDWSSLSRRRSSTTPKRTVVSRSSVSPMSTVDRRGKSPSSSPLLSRRTVTTEGLAKQDESCAVLSQLTDLSQRYQQCGDQLKDRRLLLEQVLTELAKLLHQVGQLVQWVGQKQWHEQLPATRDQCDHQLRQLRQLLDQVLERQAAAAAVHAQTEQLVARCSAKAAGADKLQLASEQLGEQFKQLVERLRGTVLLLEDLREFYDGYDQLSGWLQSKEKMLSVLGEVSCDSRLASMQLQQAAVLRDEFSGHQGALQSFNRVGNTVLRQAKFNKDAIADKVSEQLKSVNDKWRRLFDQLEAREQALAAASGASRQFNEAHVQLQRQLARLADSCEDLATERQLQPQQRLQQLARLHEQLQQLRPALTQLETLAEQLCGVLSEPAARDEVADRHQQLVRQHAQLLKKVDYLRAEADGCLREERQFGEACDSLDSWLADLLQQQLSSPLQLSADKARLLQQQADYETVYRSVMAREHEVLMLQRKGADVQSKAGGGGDTERVQQTLQRVERDWQRAKEEAVARHTRIHSCVQLANRYAASCDSFEPWLSQIEQQLSRLNSVSFNKSDTQRQIRELHSLRQQVSLHATDFDQTVANGEALLAAVDTDKPPVQQQLQQLRQRWRHLDEQLAQRAATLEHVLAEVGEFGEQLAEAERGLQRCQDALSAHDSRLASPAGDPRLVERVHELERDADHVYAQLQRAGDQASRLCEEARRLHSTAEPLREAVDQASDRLRQLQQRLADSGERLSGACKQVQQLAEAVRRLYSQLAQLEERLDDMAPVARQLTVVEAQTEEIKLFMHDVDEEQRHLLQTERCYEDLVQQGVTHEDKSQRNQLAAMQRQWQRLQERGAGRRKRLHQVGDQLRSFYRQHQHVLKQVDDAGDELEALGSPAGGDVAQLDRQQRQLRQLRASRVEPLAAPVDQCLAAGQELVQSAAAGVSTHQLQSDLDALNSAWSQLLEKMSGRESALDAGLLQSGQFREALDSLLQWLADTEELMAGQKPPAADYQVVRAQLQEQKLLHKLLSERRASLDSLVDMARSIGASCSAGERRDVDSQVAQLVARFDALNDRADRRTRQLEEAMKVAKEYDALSTPLTQWLDKMEKKVRDMEIVPTDEEKIEKRIREHAALHDGIVERRVDFDRLAAIASQLMELVSDDEAVALADRLQLLTDRYTQLVAHSEHVQQLLAEAGHQLRALVLSYEELLAWMSAMEQRLDKYRVLSVHVDKLHEQMEELTDLSEEVDTHRSAEQSLQDVGAELMVNISSGEALQLKDKLDSISHRYSDLEAKASSLLKSAQEVLPLVHSFHAAHTRLSEWFSEAEQTLQCTDSDDLLDQSMEHLMEQIQEQKPALERLNQVGPQLCQASPGDGARTIESLQARDNRRFEAIVEQVQRRSERLRLAKQKNSQLLHAIDDLLEWFHEVEGQIREAEPPGSEPDVIRVQLKEHKALNEDVAGQKSRVREVLAQAKRVLRDAGYQENTQVIREKGDQLKELVDLVSRLSSDRLGALEQALPLAEHFCDSHAQLSQWLDEAESEALSCCDLPPALRPGQISRQQQRTRALLNALSDQKPLVDRLNKTATALARLCNREEAAKISDLAESDNARYSALRASLRERQQMLEDALQACSQFSDKLDGMLTALKDTADQMNRVEPISAHPDKIQDQLAENNAIIGDLEKREAALKAVQRAADEVISQAGDTNDPAIQDIKHKLASLNQLWSHLQRATDDRGRSLHEALAVAERFWRELHEVMNALRRVQHSLHDQEPPAVEPDAIKEQQQQLRHIRHQIDQTKPDVERVKRSGGELMRVCGEPEKPEVRKNLADLGSAWDNVTALYARREENLIDAMEKSMDFHETMQQLLEFLDGAENKLGRLGPIGSDIDAVKKQIKQLMEFKNEVDPQMVKVEALNRQAHELMERTSPDQAVALKRPISAIGTRWDELLKAIVDRQRQLDQALLRLGQFQHALDELLVWIQRTDRSLQSVRPSFGDPQVIEVELAKLKVTANDVQAHQTSVDTLNDAGRQLIETDGQSADAGAAHRKLQELNERWHQLQQHALDKQQLLEKVLRESNQFCQELHDLLFWLNDLDGALTTSKPVGGLPETAREQLERFMELFSELEENRARVTELSSRGAQLTDSASEGACTNIRQSLKTLKQRWDHVMNRANDKKIKLEIALKEATEFQETLEQFIEWLSGAEKTLTEMQPVSRLMEPIGRQIEEHKEFQKTVSAHRECMLSLEKKGNQLKYFSQKQDVILIKNMLVSVQHRWERVVSKSAERTRALDVGFKEAKEFYDAWSELCAWLDEALATCDETDQAISNDPQRVRAQLDRHKQFQSVLGGRQASYDHVLRLGRVLIKEKAPRSEEPPLAHMLDTLKQKWAGCCGWSVARQRQLEEALLFSGQYREAMAALLEWLRQSEQQLQPDAPLHGDLDTVSQLCERHKAFRHELDARKQQVQAVADTARELVRKTDQKDADTITSQVSELTSLCETVSGLSEQRTARLKAALRDAERLHKAVHVLLEWLSDAEMRLRFVGSLADTEQAAAEQCRQHAAFVDELAAKETEKDATLQLAAEILRQAHADAVPVIQHWRTIIEARWQEISGWAVQRQRRLQEHAAGLADLQQLLDELLQWVRVREQKLVDLEPVPLPDSVGEVEQLVDEHQRFMEQLQSRQVEVDSICRPKHRAVRKTSRAKSSSSPDREVSPGKRSADSPEGEISREYAKPWLSNARSASPGRECSPDTRWPRIGPVFSTATAPSAGRKGSRMSASDSAPKSPRQRELWDSWRNTWMLAWERQRRLLDKLAHSREMDKLKTFDFEEWRKRFMRYANQKKLRITDLFRRMDTDNDGFLEKSDFIDGIIKTNFPSSRPEMQLVADLVDKNQDGMIDYVEFMSALKPDWEKNRPLTEAERIDDEVKKACAACTCRSKFKVFQVGEGKYRFGDSQKLRLVRILRSTVMVRVGGGWEALDEFLVKNDPCRAKGRTNVELREQFVLAPGVSQSMTPFKSKQRDASGSPAPLGRLSGAGATGGATNSTAGPITKIREKTSRSVPLSQSGRLGSGDTGLHRSSTPGRGVAAAQRETPAKSASRPASRSASRPASRAGSRAGSELSLDSVDGTSRVTPSRLPVHAKGLSSARSNPVVPLTTRSPSTDSFSLHRSAANKQNGSSNGTASKNRTTTPLGRGAKGSIQRTVSSQSIPSKLAAATRPVSREGSRSRFSARGSGDAGTQSQGSRAARSDSAGTKDTRPRWQ